MKTLPFLFAILISFPLFADSYQANDQLIEVPAPKDFGRVNAEHSNLPRFLIYQENVSTIFYLPKQVLLASHQQGPLQLSQVDAKILSLRLPETKGSDDLELDVTQLFDTIEEKHTKTDLSKPGDAETGIGKLIATALPAHFRNESMIALSSENKATLLESGKIVQRKAAQTELHLVVKGQVITLSALSGDGDLDWTRQVLPPWANAVLEANK